MNSTTFNPKTFVAVRFGESTRKDTVKLIQQKLKDAGYYPFAVDGEYGVAAYNAVIAFQQANKLQADGIVGVNTMTALMDVKAIQQATYSLDEVLAVIKSKGYSLRDKQYQINLIGLRMDDVFDNRFSDKLFVVWKNEKNEWEMSTFKWTTMPGTLGQGGVYNPVTVRGKTAVGVVKEGQYQNVWAFVDTYNGWLAYPYFYQVGRFDIFRDGNRNDVLERYMPIEPSEHDGFNCHRMSNNGVDSDIVNYNWAAWSIGCQGAPEPEFAKVVALARVSVKYHSSNLFDYTLLNVKDFEKKN